MLPFQGKETELFVYLSWNTHAGYPFLASEQARQAALQAIATGTRLRFCRLLAIESTPYRIHLVCRFPASLSISHLIGITQTTCADAVARFWEIMEPGRSLPRRLWEPTCTARTLHAMTETEAKAYLHQQMAAAAQTND